MKVISHFISIAHLHPFTLRAAETGLMIFVISYL